MLKIKGISLYYNSQKNLIHELDLDIDSNSIVGIFGPSGSGKTTLIHSIGGLLKPKSGNIYWGEKDLYSIKFPDLIYYRKNVVGYSFQNFYLLEGFSVDDNLSLPFMVGKVIDEIDLEWKEYLLKSLKMDNFLSKDIDILSGGEKERISILKSMIHKPQILICDEPGNYLNQTMRLKVYDLLVEYSQKKDNICILTSHDESAIEYFGLKNSIKNQELTIYRK